MPLTLFVSSPVHAFHRPCPLRPARPPPSRPPPSCPPSTFPAPSFLPALHLPYPLLPARPPQLHDYGGEPDAWPHVSSSFGSYDYAGFPKPAAWWFRSWWLGATDPADASRPPLANTSYFARIVESWRQSPNGTRTIHVYANAASVRLRLPSGAGFGEPVNITGFGAAAAFYDVPFSPGVLVAEALAADGLTVLASHAQASWGAPAALVLSVDAPSPRTGTGTALYLDGADVALIRATIVDAEGNTVHDASSTTVTFAVADGPVAVVGTHNGDPALQQLAAEQSVPVYGGFARAVVRVMLVAAGSASDRALLAAVNTDAGQGNASSAVLPPGQSPPTTATLTASAAGLTPGRVSLPLSVSPADAPLAVAAANVDHADVGE